MATFLRDRYAQRRPDVIMIVSGLALPFVVKHRDSFAPKVPVVFIGASSTTYQGSRPPPDITGHIIDLEANFDTTLRLAERLQPDARRLVVIAGSAPIDRNWQGIARKVVESRERKFETTWLFELPFDALADAVAKIPRDAIVIALPVFRDGAGKSFVPVEVSNRLAGLSPAPVYTPYVDHLGRGIVGAASETFAGMGRTAADVALEILNGKDPAAVPPRPDPERGPRVDYRALQRFSLSERNLPPGTVVLHKPPGIWEEHSDLVLAALLAFALQSVVLGILLVHRRRRRHAEQLLRESEERMTFAAASVNVGLWQFDRDTDEFWATEHCRALFGLAGDVPLTRETFRARVHPEDRSGAVAALRNSGAGRSTVQDVRVLRPDGELRWLRIRVRAHPSDPGSRRLNGIFLDITEQKNAENEAALQRQEVTHLMRVSVLGELSGAIAHEVNQPLTAILSNAQSALHLLARDSPDLAEVRDALQDIVHEDNRASAVVHRLRGLLKKGERSFEPVDLNALVHSTIALLNSELIGRGTHVRTELAERLPAPSGDPVQLQQILLNLMLNALDAMAATPDAERLIIVSTSVAPTGVIQLRVSDRGKGIPPEHQERLFEPFYTTKEHGLGLGLTICASIMRAHGGGLMLGNDVRGGAVAVLSLPMQDMDGAFPRERRSDSTRESAVSATNLAAAK
jgi:PAS domain S-box-containing protein